MLKEGVAAGAPTGVAPAHQIGTAVLLVIPAVDHTVEAPHALTIVVDPTAVLGMMIAADAVLIAHTVGKSRMRTTRRLLRIPLFGLSLLKLKGTMRSMRPTSKKGNAITLNMGFSLTNM